MPTPEQLKKRIEGAIPGSTASVEDLTGTGDHFRAEVVSDRFEGLSRIEQHQLVYSIFGTEIGGPIHALSATCGFLSPRANSIPYLPCADRPRRVRAC